MDSTLIFDSVTFTYPGEDAPSEPVFTDLSCDLPGGLTFLVGPNGIGKTTFMLLAGGRLFPQSGRVTLLGHDTLQFIDASADPVLEGERNRLAAFIYQNMEFETEEPLGAVLDAVGASATDPAHSAGRLSEILAVTQLEEHLSQRMQELSKGEMQRAILAMSLLYGSPVVFMDEPLFAVEPLQAEMLLEYIRDDCRRRKVAVYASVHDVTLARSCGDEAVLFFQDGRIQSGPASHLLKRETLEQAFKAPWDTLYERQQLYRRMLREV